MLFLCKMEEVGLTRAVSSVDEISSESAESVIPEVTPLRTHNNTEHVGPSRLCPPYNKPCSQPILPPPLFQPVPTLASITFL